MTTSSPDPLATRYVTGNVEVASYEPPGDTLEGSALVLGPVTATLSADLHRIERKASNLVRWVITVDDDNASEVDVHLSADDLKAWRTLIDASEDYLARLPEELPA